MTLDQLIEQCLEPATKTYRAASGQTWKVVREDRSGITLVPEYPCSKHDSITMPWSMFRQLGWKEVE